MTRLTSRVVYSVLFFVLTSVLLVVAKPKQMFDEEGKPKPFGIGPGKTLFSLGTAILVLAVASFYVFSLLGMITACSGATRREREAAQMHMYKHATTNVVPTTTYVASPPPPPPPPPPQHMTDLPQYTVVAPPASAPSVPAATSIASSQQHMYPMFQQQQRII
jgi:hypothetical protein